MKLTRWTSAGLLLIVAGLLTVTSLVWAGGTATVEQNQYSAVGALRSLNTALYVYRDTYKMGFAPGLGVLAPGDDGKETPWGANLITAELARGVKSGYKIIYRPGPEDASGHIQTYQISVRPIEFGVTGRRSFFTDETAIIRSTGENREANAQDQPL